MRKSSKLNPYLISLLVVITDFVGLNLVRHHDYTLKIKVDPDFFGILKSYLLICPSFGEVNRCVNFTFWKVLD